MDQPPPDQSPPDIPIAPPRLNVRMLWLHLLLPMVLTAIFMGLLLLAGSGQGEQNLLNLGMFVVGITSLFCWIGFSKCIAERFIGPSLILLILAYPIIQTVLIFCTFFAGCLLLIQTQGLY